MHLLSTHLDPISFKDQITLLQKRGMLFLDKDRAEKYFAYIGYHRLSSYWNAFYKNKETKEEFLENIYFENILDLYIFDRKLRVLFFEASERIEVCLKVLFSDIMSIQFNDCFWYKNKNIFRSEKDTYYIDCKEYAETRDYNWIATEINNNLSKFKKSNDALAKFINFDKTPIPSWTLVDLITFGNLSNLINLVKGEFSNDLYEKFDLPKKILDNWLECIVNVRNICAHYGLLYRRSFSTTPISLSKSKKRPYLIDFENCKMSFYAQFFIFSYFMLKISPTSSWTQRTLNLIKEHLDNPLLDLNKLGFPNNWSDNVIFEKFKNSF